MVVKSWQRRWQSGVRRAWDTTVFQWHLGFTAFGGPPVHFKIVSAGMQLIKDYDLTRDSSMTSL